MSQRFLQRLGAPLAIVLTLLLGGCTSASYVRLTDFAVHSERESAQLVRKELTLPSGLHMVWLEGGQGAPMVLVHGFGGNKDNFTRVARYLTPHYRVIVPDLTGFGESSHPQEADYHVAAQAERLREFVLALKLGPVHLGGNSMGGAIAMSYAAHHADEVASLWLLDAAGAPSAPPSELRKIIETTGHNPLLVTNEDDFAKVLRFAMTDPPYIPIGVSDVMAQERIRNQALEKRVFDQIATDSVEKDVDGLRTPTLIVWGEDDRVIEVRTADVLHRLLPRSRVIVMRRVGHVPMVERPQRTAEDYLQFLATLDSVPTRP